MKVTLKDYMGSDLTVVNAARVSFNKEVDWEYEKWDIYKDEGKLNPRDIKLINYLATHGHWTPFSHPQISLHVKAPIFVLRQLLKHQVGLAWNEVSRRYVDYEPEFFLNKTWRGKPKDKKQGSSTEIVLDDRTATAVAVLDFYAYAKTMYAKLIYRGVAPEQARMVLPLATYSEGIWTGSLAAFARVYKLRIQPDAQKETQEIVQQIGEIISNLFPISWAALTKDYKNA